MSILNYDLWRERNFILYFYGVLVSKLSEKIYLIAIPWLIYDLTASSIGVGTMFLIETIPFIFISPIAGVLADRFSRKFLLISSVLLQGLFICIIPVLDYLDKLEIWYVYIFGFLISCASSCFAVVDGTIIPQIFKENTLIRINSVYQLLDSSSVLIGSALAGLLISKIGVMNILLILSFSSILVSPSILFLKFLAKEHLTVDKKSISKNQFWEGVQYLAKHPILGPLTLLTLIVNIANASLISMLVFFARDNLSLSSQEIGLVYSGAGIAQLLAIFFLVTYFHKKGTPIKIMLVNLFVSSIGIIVVSLSWNWIVLLIGVSLQSAPVIVFNVFNRTLRQEIVPTYIFGRVNGITIMLGLMFFPLSGFLTGIFSEWIDIRYIFSFLAITTILFVFIFYNSSLKNHIEIRENEEGKTEKI